jgi:polyisoprenoid-binding protein YceI
MQKPFTLLLLTILVLTGCTSAAPTTEAPSATGTNPAPTAAATAPAASESTPAAASEADPTQGSALPSTGAVTYRLVPGETQVTYEVGETFFNENNRFNVAEGSTQEVAGEIQVDLANPQNSQVGTLTADISLFTSDSSRRDQAIRDRFLESRRFPTATFTPTEILGLPATYTPGEEIQFTVVGDATIRDVTLPVTFEVTARATPEELRGTAETTFLMSEFGFGPILMAGILGTEDEVKIRVSFLARP